ncbi:MAG: alpha/beta hydrolase fold domain-containing protein [Phycisphaeraceae bacterium]|nr:alpha/beta hydrolase fold domain-containing protein [Phycisphaeraceae bacterium]
MKKISSWIILWALCLASVGCSHSIPEKKSLDHPAQTPAPVHSELDIYVLIGQSNMAGRGVVEDQDVEVVPRVLTLTRENTWAPATDPIHFDKKMAGVGPGRTFGIVMAEQTSSSTIGLVPCAVGGTSIRFWQPGAHDKRTDTHPYDDMLARVTKAMQHGTLKGILWHQGESDSAMGSEGTYLTKLVDLVNRLRNDLGGEPVPFVAGQLGRFESRPWGDGRKKVDLAHKHLSGVLYNTGFVYADGLTDKGDRTHFDARSARTLGRRFAAKMLELQRKTDLCSARHTEQILWPAGAPDARDVPDTEVYEKGQISNVHRPTLTAFYPHTDIANGRAVIICPGGGYRVLSIEKEGYQIARWLNEQGITAFVLKYRLTRPDGTGYHYPAQLNDLKKAIQTVRHHASDYHADPKKIGVMGFSAGGHLASTLGTHFDSGEDEATDPVSRVRNRPDFMILVYPHISLTDPGTSQSYVSNLLGAHYEAELPEFLSNEKQVTDQTPRTFLVHAHDDRTVPSIPSVEFYLALRRAGVSAELHVFDTGGHGFGLGERFEGVKHWPSLCQDWLAGLDL